MDPLARPKDRITFTVAEKSLKLTCLHTFVSVTWLLDHSVSYCSCLECESKINIPSNGLNDVQVFYCKPLLADIISEYGCIQWRINSRLAGIDRRFSIAYWDYLEKDCGGSQLLWIVEEYLAVQHPQNSHLNTPCRMNVKSDLDKFDLNFAHRKGFTGKVRHRITFGWLHLVYITCLCVSRWTGDR